MRYVDVELSKPSVKKSSYEHLLIHTGSKRKLSCAPTNVELACR